MKNYVLNLNAQTNGDYEVHHTDCLWRPISNFERLGYYLDCKGAVNEAKRRHPYKKINGCKHCSLLCHTT